MMTRLLIFDLAIVDAVAQIHVELGQEIRDNCFVKNMCSVFSQEI